MEKLGKIDYIRMERICFGKEIYRNKTLLGVDEGVFKEGLEKIPGGFVMEKINNADSPHIMAFKSVKDFLKEIEGFGREKDLHSEHLISFKRGRIYHLSLGNSYNLYARPLGILKDYSTGRRYLVLETKNKNNLCLEIEKERVKGTRILYEVTKFN